MMGGPRNKKIPLIAAIILSGSIPLFLWIFQNDSLVEATRQVTQDMSLAKMFAGFTKQAHGIYFNCSGTTVQGTYPQRYTLFRDSGTTPNQLDANDHVMILNWSLPDTTSIQRTSFPSNTVVFQAPLSKSKSGSIILRNQERKTRSIDISW